MSPPMKNAWIRLVFVLCTLSTLLYVGFGLGSLLSNDGKVFMIGPQAEESASIFMGFMLFHVGLSILLHVLSFVITGVIVHLECMFHWLVPPLVVAVICFITGERASEGLMTAFALPCNGWTAFILAAGTGGYVCGVVFEEYYGKLTGRPSNE